MNTKAIAALALVSALLLGCAPAEDAETGQEEPEIEAPASQQSITVEEEVIVPAHEPEPEPEPEEETEPELTPAEALLQDHNESDKFSKGNPEIGEVLSTNVLPRRVMVVFQWPLLSGTDIQVWDKDKIKRFDRGETIIANDESVVAFTYLEELDVGIYKVEYTAEFAGMEDEEYDSEGYYYFRIVDPGYT
jgi:hypothetical protein